MRGPRPPSARGGFTLVEVAVATAIVGLAMAALMVAAGSATRINDAGRKITQAVFLAQEFREWTVALPFSDPDPADADNPPGPDGSDPQTFVDDLDDLMDVTFCPPRDGQGYALTELPDWSQTVTLTWRDPADLGSVVSPGSSDIILVQLSLAHNGEPVMTTQWLVTRGGNE